MDNKKVTILGAGIAGLSLSYFLNEAKIESIVYEKESTLGGLCKSFEKNGFWFDYGGHCSFTKDEYIRAFLEDGVERDISVNGALNYYKGIWIKHPVQINLAMLKTEEKIKILSEMLTKSDNFCVTNYMDWLVHQYGEYFATNFPARYTRKYWTTDASNLETKWIGPRMYIPTTEEVLYGAFETDTKAVHYSGECRYPKRGGFQKYIEKYYGLADAKINKDVTKIDPNSKTIFFTDGTSEKYEELVSTLPLNKTGEYFVNCPENVKDACKKLKQTSLVLVSVGIDCDININDAFYVYDEDILFARGYSTSKFGKNNAPEGCTSLQLEVYYSDFKPLCNTIEEIKDKVISQCVDMGLFGYENILVSDVQYKEYANIIFTPEIYECRDIVHEYLNEKDVFYTGRFGDWDYYWVDQTIASAKKLSSTIRSKLMDQNIRGE